MSSPKSGRRRKGRKRNNDNERETEVATAGVPPLSNNNPINAQAEADPATPKATEADPSIAKVANPATPTATNIASPKSISKGKGRKRKNDNKRPATPKATEADLSIAEAADPATPITTDIASPKSISKGKGRKRKNDNDRGTEAATAGMPPLSNEEPVDAQTLTTEEKSHKKPKHNNDDKGGMEAATAGVTLSLDVEPPTADPTTPEATEAYPATPKATEADPSIREATEADPPIPDATKADPATPAVRTPSVRPSTNMDPVDAQGMEEQQKEGANAGALNDDTSTVIVEESFVEAGTDDIAQVSTDDGNTKRAGGNCDNAGKEDSNKVFSFSPNSDAAGTNRVLPGPTSCEVVVVDDRRRHIFSLDFQDYSGNSNDANNTNLTEQASLAALSPTTR
jgi:hypothetical protein